MLTFYSFEDGFGLSLEACCARQFAVALLSFLLSNECWYGLPLQYCESTVRVNVLSGAGSGGTGVPAPPSGQQPYFGQSTYSFSTAPGAYGVPVGQVSVANANGGYVTYSISGTSYFTINPQTGQITANGNLQPGTYTFTVNAQTQYGTASTTVTVQVLFAFWFVANEWCYTPRFLGPVQCLRSFPDCGDQKNFSKNWCDSFCDSITGEECSRIFVSVSASTGSKRRSENLN